MRTTEVGASRRGKGRPRGYIEWVDKVFSYLGENGWSRGCSFLIAVPYPRTGGTSDVAGRDGPDLQELVEYPPILFFSRLPGDRRCEGLGVVSSRAAAGNPAATAGQLHGAQDWSRDLIALDLAPRDLTGPTKRSTSRMPLFVLPLSSTTSPFLGRAALILPDSNALSPPPSWRGGVSLRVSTSPSQVLRFEKRAARSSASRGLRDRRLRR